MFNISSAQITHAFDPSSSIDVEVLLGVDWLNANPFP
jgi:hypothetical protein